ncbi:DNA repair protein RAD51-like 4 [Quillaja saponaria]|uniref:DNA repair protein RAD51-like 4 n=1 Tax=Quillaja saponaria TaxID=32244 RepID=A0AAD7QG64_QUISA|nr:DNA repair protein RAD51-like 4 [Quillaja saponaria]
MAPLKSMEQEYPIIDAAFQKFCASHGIFSVEDLLMCDIDALMAFADKEPKSEKLKQGFTQILTIIDGLHQPWLNGLDLLEDAKWNKHVLSTGCKRMDELLQGGLRKGQLTELVGPSSSGKTQVCLQVASSVAKMQIGSVLYLDTGNSFSPRRIAQFVHKSSGSVLNYQADHIPLQKVMNSVLCHSVFDIFAMFDILHQLEINMKSQIHKADHQVQLLIVDSISSLITPILGGSGPQGHALMISAGFLLKKLAHEHNLAVLVTNHMVGGEGGITKPALGESWKSVPHVRLLLSRDHGSNICNVSVLKHSSIAFGREASFMIYD